MRPEILFPLFKNVADLKGIGPKTSKWIKLLCGRDLLIDVLFHLPHAILKRQMYHHEIILSDTPVVFKAKILQYQIPRLKRLPLKILMEADFGEVEVIYFNYHLSSFTEKFPPDSVIWLSGKLVHEENKYTMIHPDYFTSEKEKIPMFEALYPMIQKISSSSFSKVVKNALTFLPDLPEWSDEKVLEKKGWPAWKEALLSLHAPQTDNKQKADLAFQRLAYDEFLSNQLALKIIRQFHQKQAGISCEVSNRYSLSLPFKLTQGQRDVLKQLNQDLASAFPMNRLLQGDVGSGKTIVALLSALQVISSGYQVALMAPTDILARQHYDKILKLLEPLGISVALLTAKEKGKVRHQILEDLQSGKISLIIGTHALIEDNVQFQKLGYVIVDEQHRFGVNQRLNLIKKQKGCNLLVMSATPIPRSLAMTTYGDMEISLLTQKPVGRKPVQTCLMSFSQIPEMVQKLKQTKAQTYWVCPLIEESEKSDMAAVEKRFTELKKEFGALVGLLHGKMKSEEKDKVVNDFKTGKIQILVSTTVVEVGVDVPDACVMIIEQAERFGLATLHQLRGRVGRGNQAGFCLLLHGKLNEKAKERLMLLRDTEDGFKIANADLKMRGAGQILGTRQSGFEEFRLAQLPVHQDLLDLAHEQAENILSQDPHLEMEKNKNLHILLYLFEKEKAIMTLKAG